MQTQISVYIRIDQAEKLEHEENKSKVIREALDLYYNQKEGNKMKKTYYETNEDGSYFEFELEDGRSGVIDSVAGIREVPVEMEGMGIQEIIEEYGEGEILEKPMNPEKEDNKMTREELIKKLKGNTLEVDAGWLEENDSELLDWITSSKYWGRGVDYNLDREDAVVRIIFDEGGVAYIATHDSEGVDVEQSLNNQPYWGEDEWGDWDDEQLELYYQKTNQ